ncbi:MAG: putative Ig domain-containing protein [Limisphaera sp.]|nr:putative Ig domain-containing protein [Limisphaera sp.]
MSLPCEALCYILAAAGCIPGPVGCFFAGFNCSVGFGNAYTVGDTVWAAVDCVVGVVGCLVPVAGIPACIYSILRCIQQSLGLGAEIDMAGGPQDPGVYFARGVRASLRLFEELLGTTSDVWIHHQTDHRLGDWWARFMASVAVESEQGRWLSERERSNLLTGELPPGVPEAEVRRFLGRWNRSMENWSRGIWRHADAAPGADLDFIDSEILYGRLQAVGAYQQEAMSRGFTDPLDGLVETVRQRLQEAESGGVCAKVKIRLDQEAVLSREAFRATLEIDNATGFAVDKIRVEIRLTDGAGRDLTHLFGIRPPELRGVSDIHGTGRVPGGSKGSARWTIIPTVDAAPVAPTLYYVTGEFSYEFNGAQVKVPLTPVPITVNPTARLTLDYFHQRDVYADDPFTDVVEPSIPFSLAVMVHNWGAGPARNFRITSAQPEIVDDEKGLLIDFKIMATEVAGQHMTPTLTASFGDISPGGRKIARWLMTSTLQGLFVNYNATFEHLDGLGNPRLSLIEEVRIHEMIRMIQAGPPFEDGLPDFLVNDLADTWDLPDTLWLSDGSSNAVAVVTNATVTGALSLDNLQVTLRAELPPGWSYLRVRDPADGRYQLTAVRRSDGRWLAVTNNFSSVWITDRTFLGMGKRPRRENILHLLDHNSTGEYTLIYQSLPARDIEPPNSMVEALPSQSRSAFLVRWVGQDNEGGSGIIGYDIYYSEDGGPLQRWLNATPAAGAMFQGILGRRYAFYSVAIDAAGNRESVPAAPDAETLVTLENRAPVFVAQTNVALWEGETLSMWISASDPDGDAVTYRVGPDAPAGVMLHPASGLLTWLTAEPHGPSTNRFTILATDSGMPSLTSTQMLHVIVLESNTPPVLGPLTNATVSEGALLSFVAVAADSDSPAQTLRFSLGPGAPAGATIDPASGVFRWRPTEFQGGTNYRITIVVTDNGVPALSASQSFLVTVADTRADFLLHVGEAVVLTNASGALPLTLQSGTPLSHIKWNFSVEPGRLSNLRLADVAATVGAVTLVPLGEERYRLSLEARAGQSLQGNLLLGQLVFDTTPNPRSGLVYLKSIDVVGQRGGASVAEGRGGVGRVFIIGAEPILDLQRAPEGLGRLVLYALPGRLYTIEQNVQVRSDSWRPHQVVVPSGLRTELAPILLQGTALFFRVRLGEPDPRLTIRLESEQVVLEWLAPCDGCSLWQTPHLGAQAEWSRVPAQPELVGNLYRLRLPLQNRPMFFQLRKTERAPELHVREESGRIVLEWPASCLGCRLLQSSSVQPGAVWSPVAVEPELVGDRYRVVLVPAHQPMFFRLLRP